MRTHGRRMAVGTTLALLLAAWGCGPPETFNRKQMLRDTVDQVILPTHEELTSKTGELQSAVQSYCEGDRKSGQLKSAREAWRGVQKPLKHIQAWSFNMSPYRGSSFDILLYKIDREPSYGDNIEAVIDGDKRYRSDIRADGDEKPDHPFPNGDKTIDLEFVKNQDYRRSAKGYPAIEYLLFGSPEGTSTQEAYSAGNKAADRRCEYLLQVTEHANKQVDAYVKAWSPDDGNFAELFRGPSSENMDWTTVQDSINAMVSGMVFVTKQRISKELLGGPLGQHADNPNIPDSVSSPHAQATKMQIRAIFEGMEMLYSGPGGKSLADYTKFRKSAVHKDVREGIKSARGALEGLPTPLSKAVDNDESAVQSAQSEVDSLTQLIEADLKTSLGASTTRVVVDND